MTDKQKRIINIATKEFANKGYYASSTRSIANKAQVSEGLIFKHFNSKEGLLKKIIENNEKYIQSKLEIISKLTHPRVVLKNIITIPFNLKDEELDVFKLIYNLRTKVNDPRIDFFKYFYKTIHDAFMALGSTDVESETQSFIIVLEGCMSVVIRKKHDNNFLIVENFLRKFNI